MEVRPSYFSAPFIHIKSDDTKGTFCYDEKMKKRAPKYFIGIDEVGRGPLAGPVAVGVVKLKVESLKVHIRWTQGLRDSKKLSPKAREAWFVKIEEAREEGWLEYPHYTRPPVFREMAVPEPLRSGDHGRIATWRKLQSVASTTASRPDLLRARTAQPRG